MHPAYQQIIGLGKEAIPFLLRELEQKSGRWFWALKSITREDPLQEEHKGNTQEMIDTWLDWGHRNGYTWQEMKRGYRKSDNGLKEIILIQSL